MVDCDIYESENWLGTGKCKYSWECRGARQCEGQGWCYGDDACKEIHEWVNNKTEANPMWLNIIIKSIT